MERDPASTDNQSQKDEPARGNWGGQLEFILTCVGYAVGLGNVWRFPYLCYKNGGGAFLVPYFVVLAIIGLPLFFMELAFGQFASLGPIAIWTVNPLFKGLGYSMVITNTVIGLYYNVIIAWTIYYFFASMTSELPWQECGHEWNTALCTTTEQFRNYTMNNITDLSIGNDTVLREDLKTPAEEYFYNGVLRMSDGIGDTGGIVWPLAACLFLAWSIVFLVLIKGISSLGKAIKTVVYFSSIFPYVLLTVMLIRGVTLDGSTEGMLYYISPDFNRLTDARVWSDAATQIFYSLSTCTGGLIAMASYNKFKNNCYRDSFLVPIINCFTSFYAGFVIFSVLGFMAKEKHVSVANVAASGPGLVFVVYPEALTQMPLPPVWSVLFFFMLMTLGFSSEFSIMECFFSSVIDELDFVRKSAQRKVIFRAVFCFVFFLIGLSMITNSGFYVFNIVDAFVGGFPLLFVGLLETIAIQFIYGFSNFSNDIEMMLGRKPGTFMKVTWLFLVPFLLLVIIVFLALQYERPSLFSGVYSYPAFAEGFGWLIVAACLLPIPIFFLFNYMRLGGCKVLREANRPRESWGPAAKEDRIGRYDPNIADFYTEYATKGEDLPGYENHAYVISEHVEETSQGHCTERSVVCNTCGKPPTGTTEL
ncbi:hypothetical protein CAPTEDRAFT_121763 [Capitella teleta]|uniref:Transporter n=1 Tax=Capitella teleta TaxID=283909 RepID=R7UIB2_CAPTE|nr:hypothetical protein CAPTEDRAFT_121763 [Capitella teleta]|eukprot:ELU02987.1 hypothetical protein CAPTEDRAFT_121763 [Capitella teleta]